MRQREWFKRWRRREGSVEELEEASGGRGSGLRKYRWRTSQAEDRHRDDAEKPAAAEPRPWAHGLF